MSKPSPNLHRRLRFFFRTNEFLLLLIALFAFLFIPAFVTNSDTKDILIYSLLVAVLLIGVYELSDSKRSFYPGIVLALLAITSNSLDFSDNNTLVFLIRMGSLISFFGLLTVHVLIRMRKAARVTSNAVFAAIDGYILIGLIGGMGFRLINHFYPHSFVFTNGLDARIDDLTYFSFITLSTLGYGDITPVTPPGQSLAVFISICGQLYLAIVIGIIIGKYVLHRNKD